MAKGKRTIGQTLHTKLKIEQTEHHNKNGDNLASAEALGFPSPTVPPVVHACYC